MPTSIPAKYGAMDEYVVVGKGYRLARRYRLSICPFPNLLFGQVPR